MIFTERKRGGEENGRRRKDVCVCVEHIEVEKHGEEGIDGTGNLKESLKREWFGAEILSVFI